MPIEDLGHGVWLSGDRLTCAAVEYRNREAVALIEAAAAVDELYASREYPPVAGVGVRLTFDALYKGPVPQGSKCYGNVVDVGFVASPIAFHT